MLPQINKGIFMNIEELALNDAWTVATESQQELAAIVEDMTKLAEEEGKVEEWNPAIRKLKRAEAASGRASAALKLLIPASDK